MLASILVWYLTMQLMALVGLPAAFSLFRKLPSRGYATAKALGLLLTGVVFWWGGIARLWGNTSGAVLTAAILVLSAGLVLMRGNWRDLGAWWRSNRRHVAVVEVLFLTALTAWAVVRSSQPQLQTAGGEKWMEIAFLNAVLRAPKLPPQDPWLSGFGISYYYLGYLLLGMLTRLSALAPTIAFNLGNAGWYALVAVQAYSLVYDMTQGKGLFRSLIAPLMLLVTGNGEGLLEVLHARGYFSGAFWGWLDINRLDQAPQPPHSPVPQRFFWWWQASRTIRDRTPWGDVQEVIAEFPAFSFLLGDMHPHLLALPFVLVAVSVALNAYRHAAEGQTSQANHGGKASAGPITFQQRAVAWAQETWKRLRRGGPATAGCAIVLGALGFLNTWDFPIYWAVVIGAWILGRYAHQERSLVRFLDVVWEVLPEAVVLGILSVVLYLPFWFALRSQAGGILPNLFNATKAQHYVVMFLPLLVPVVGVVAGAARGRGVRLFTAVGVGFALVVGIALLALIVGSTTAYPYILAILRRESVQGYSLPPETALAALRMRLRTSWLAPALAIAAAAVGLSLIQLPRSRNRERAEPQRSLRRDVFPLLIVLMGLLLTLAPEFVYLKDVFMTRMNTVFKFYFQAWVLWSLAGAWQLCQWLAPSRTQARLGGSRLAASALSALLIAVGLVYTGLAVPARAREQGVPFTLDGAAWMTTAHPEDAAAIAWLNSKVTGTPVIVEAPGDQNRAYTYEGRVSALTGLPTLLGWGGHQLQWRGNYDEPAVREADLQRLMTTTDPEEAARVLARYDVTYVYIGPLERQRYTSDALNALAKRYPAVYDQQGVVIYKVK